MGETGGDKTALLRFMIKYILQEEFEVFNFHAGITQTIIIEKMNYFKEKAEKLKQ